MRTKIQPHDLLNSSDRPSRKHVITFDDSGLEASFKYLQNKSNANFKKLVYAPGNKLAYVHYLWSNFDAKMTIEEFWSRQLSQIRFSAELQRRIQIVSNFLLGSKRTVWLNEVLRYLPNGHLFRTTVYFNLGYDNIVLGENVALNLNSRLFDLDKRESIYYLIHELAHAGYVKYHALPQLWKAKTNAELLSVVRFLTHLEGMGVLSSFRLRVSEDGLLANDYKILLNKVERSKRIDNYFRILSKLENNSEKKIDKPYFAVFDRMSGQKTRLWYITGCHMAQEIEKHCGIETLRKLVKRGSEEFFSTYLEFDDPTIL
jgi:hypothetical protein